MELKQKINSLAKKTKTISISTAAILGDDVIFSHAYGNYNQEKNLKATTDTIYRIASASKPISCIVLMTLVDKKLVELDANIGNYLGYEVRNPHYKNEPITLRHLMTHTSSIVETGSYNKILAGQMPPYKLSEVLVGSGYSNDNFLNAKPGSKYCYSSFGTGILGAIIEKVTGKKFADYARDCLFLPLGMNASFNPDYFAKDGQIAVPIEVGTSIDEKMKEWLAKSLANKKKLSDLPIGEAYRIAQGNVYIKANDLAKLMRIFFNDGKVGKVRILSPESASEMTKIQFSDENISTGLGLFHLDHIAPGIIGHYGRAYGAFTLMAFNPNIKKGAVVLTNGTDPKVDEHGHTITCTDAFIEIYKSIEQLI